MVNALRTVMLLCKRRRAESTEVEIAKRLYTFAKLNVAVAAFSPSIATHKPSTGHIYQPQLDLSIG